MGFLRSLFVICALGLASTAAAFAQDVVGTITDGSGEIVVTSAGGVDQQGGIGTEVHQYDRIFVGDGSGATITFIDQTILTLAAGSALTIDEMVYDPAGQDNSALFTLAGGLMGLVSGDVLKTGDMTVTTPVSTIGIRGTTVLIDSGTTVSRSSTGELLLSATTDSGEVVTLVLSADGTVGSIMVQDRATGATTIVTVFGDSVITAKVNGGTLQTKTSLTPEQIRTRFLPLVGALQNAVGKDLSNPENAADADSLEENLKELFEEIEASPS